MQIKSGFAYKPLQYIQTSEFVACQVRSRATGAFGAAPAQGKEKESAVRCAAFAITKEQLRGTTASFVQKDCVRARPCSAAHEQAALALTPHCADHLGSLTAATL